MDFLVDENNKRAVIGLNSDAEFQFASPLYGEVIPARVARLQPAFGVADRLWQPQDIENYGVRVGIGLPFQVPLAGTFQLIFQSSNTAPVPYNATQLQVQNALNALAAVSAVGGVVVTGSSTYYIITFNIVDAQNQITADVGDLAPVSVAEVGKLIIGDADKKEVQYIRVLQNAACISSLSDYTGVPSMTVDVLQVGNAMYNHKIRVTFNTLPFDGAFTMSVGSLETNFISWNATADDIATKLGSLSTVGQGNAEVLLESSGSFLVIFTGNKANTDMGTIVASGSTLQVVPYMGGNIDLRSAALELLFPDGADSVDCSMEIEITPPGGLPRKIYKNSITIDAPVIIPESLVNVIGEDFRSFTLSIPTSAETITVVFPSPLASVPKGISLTLGTGTSGISYLVTVDRTTVSTSGFTAILGYPAASGDVLYVTVST